MRCWGHDQPSTCAVGAFRGRPDSRPARLAGDPAARSGSRPRSAGRTPVRQRARGPPRPAALQGHPAAAHPSTLPRSPGAPGRRGRVRSLPEPTHTSEPAEFLLPRAPSPTPGRLTCPRPRTVAAEAFLELFPDMGQGARAWHAFLERTVHYLAGKAGIRQFLDVGTGLPTHNNTHEVAQAITPGPHRLRRQRPARTRPRPRPDDERPVRNDHLPARRSARARTRAGLRPRTPGPRPSRPGEGHTVALRGDRIGAPPQIDGYGAVGRKP